ncbi:MAG: hypothetical protein AAF909_06395 [Pseudomonadota bacterium]
MGKQGADLDAEIAALIATASSLNHSTEKMRREVIAYPYVVVSGLTLAFVAVANLLLN